MKSFFNKTIFYGTLMTLMSVSCTHTEESEVSNGDKVAVRFSASVQTRATNNVWNEKDVIGISMMNSQGQAIVGTYQNYAYITPGDGNFSSQSTDKIMYFPEDGSSVCFKAYYPYRKNLPASQVVPLSVQDQTSLDELDFMTAVQMEGNCIDEPDVRLHFYHRMSKVIIDLTTDETELIDLRGCKLTMKGLKTAGVYDLINEKLTVDATSDNDVNIPLHSAKGNALLLPRPAGQGIVFEVTTANGGTYTAIMADDLELEAGYKYTFHIRLKSTPVKVSATIEPWKEGPEHYSDVIRLVTGLKDSKDFQVNDTLRLFLKEKEDADFNYLSTFTYDDNGAWKAKKAVYWESIVSDPASFRGATRIASQLNQTQMADILISKDIQVAQYTGVNLEMAHAGAKATIRLKSSDGTFTSKELQTAAIVLPDYLNEGSINAKGEFVKGSKTTDILPENGVAIFPPQTIASGKNLMTVTINGRQYPIEVTESEGFEYLPGTAYTLTADIRKTEVLISSVVKPWIEETIEFQDIRIGSAALQSNGGDLQSGDQLYLYTGDLQNRTTLDGYYAYNGSMWNYSDPSAPLYWEDIANSGSIYASITRPALSGANGNNQSKDYITATPVANDGGVANTAINLQLAHQVAKVNVILWSETYKESDLTQAKITLPDYEIGGQMQKGLYSKGTEKGTIRLDSPVKVLPAKSGAATTYHAASYLQGQIITKGTPLVLIEMGGRTYTVKYSENLAYTPGKVTNLKIQIEKAELKVSAEVSGWTEQPPVIFNHALFFTVVDASVEGFTDNDKILFYKMNASGVTDNTNTYTYIEEGAIASFTQPSQIWYRDDFQTGDQIAAVFPVNAQTKLAAGTHTFSWTCNDGTSGETFAHNEDIIVAAPVNGYGTVKEGSANVALQFRHVLSKVTVNLIVGTGFSSAEIKNSLIELNKFKLSGDINIETGAASATETIVPAFAPSAKATANTLDGKTVVSSYEAFVMPQTITATPENPVAIVTVTLNGVKFYGKISAGKTFKAGEHNVLNITLNKVGLVLSTELVDWTYGGSYDMDLH